MNFSQALEEAKNEKLIRRKLWASRGLSQWMELVQLTSANDGRAVMPLLMIESEDGILRPFGGTMWDLLADDWEVKPGL